MANRLRQLAMLATTAVQKMLAPPGRMTAFDPQIDSLRHGVMKNLTFAAIEAILDNGKDGDLSAALTFFEEMEQRWGRLGSVAATRRLALTGLEWEVASAADTMDKPADKKLADEAAAYTRETLKRLKGFRTALKHLATSIGRNVAVCEVEWSNDAARGPEPVDIFPVYSNRLTMQLQRSAAVHVITRDNLLGIPATAPKFVVAVPHATSGSPLWRSMAEGHAWLFLIWKLMLSDWGTFCELFGIPFRHATYQQGATPQEKTEVVNMLKGMGSTGWALTSKAVQIAFVESTSRGIAPFEGILNFCNREVTVMYLGGNITNDTTGGRGLVAEAEMQSDVRGDIRDDDIQNESGDVSEQFIKYICGFRFPGWDVPCPVFRRIKPETIDRIKESAAIKAAQVVGLSIGLDWAYKRLAIPKPKPEDELLEPLDAFADAVREETTGEGT